MFYRRDKNMIMIKKIMYEWKKISNSGLLIETLNNTQIDTDNEDE